VGGRAEIAAVVRRVIEVSWPGRFSADDLGDDVPLDETGLGLDSVEVIEVLFASEHECGVQASEELFTVPLTIGRIADHLGRDAT
jgi:acyl carrier protein